MSISLPSNQSLYLCSSFLSPSYSHSHRSSSHSSSSLPPSLSLPLSSFFLLLSLSLPPSPSLSLTPSLLLSLSVAAHELKLIMHSRVCTFTFLQCLRTCAVLYMYIGHT